MTVLPSVNPATLDVLGEVPIAGPSEVDQAVQAAWSAFKGWQLTSFEERKRLMLRLWRAMEQRKDELAQLISEEVGKPLVESYLGDIAGPLDTCIWLAEKAQQHLKDQTIRIDNPLLLAKRSIITFEPLGVIGIIAPWNYPFAIPMMTTLMAVMVGNTVVIKPSEKAARTGQKISELFTSAGFPENVVSVITGDQKTGRYLSASPLAKLFFTGSVGGGIQVMSQAAPNLTPVTLELGGKDAAIVLADASLDWTVPGLIWGAFTNAGQACASIERLYLVKSKNTDQLLEKLVDYAKRLRVGPAAQSENEIGPLIDKAQFDKVVAQVDEAVRQGAKILCGGERVAELRGYFYKPTVLINVTQSMRIMSEETFGPVLPVMVVENEEEAVSLVNQSEYGLTASIWTNNITRGKKLARQLKVGTVFINDGLFSHAAPQLPWGGLRKSGFGRSHSYFGLLDLVNIKHISLDRAGGLHRIWWYPYSNIKSKLVRGGLQFVHGNSHFKKGQGLYDFLANIFRKE